MEGARHVQDLANCKALRMLSEKIKNAEQFSSEACIFKVREELRKTNPEAYTPLVISIGPYHHGKSELRKMERSKELYTQSFLNRAQGGVSVEEFWKKLRDLEGKAKSYYGDLDDIQFVDEDEFVKMLLLDGCFIVEFVIRQSRLVMNQNRIVDPISMIPGMVGRVCRDMMLLENQLPFFVLQALYDMISNYLSVKPEFSEMVKCAFEYWLPKKPIISLRVYPGQEIIKHLLQLVHILCQPQPQNNAGQIQQEEEEEEKACSSCCSWKQPQGGGSDIESQSLSNGQHRHRNWACFLCKFWEQPQQSTTDEHEVELCSIRTASELQEAGVHFKKLGKINETVISLFDIKFNHARGVLEIPSFALYDSTETFFRNLIAYEQHSLYVRPKYFTDHAVFMDDLINTEKDVNLLRLKGVFINGLGDDKQVTRLFNNLCKEVTYSSNDFYYSDVCKELNRHCKKPWNAAKAKLRRNYFHSPWAGISTFAAILLLSLAIAQTVLSALDLHK